MSPNGVSKHRPRDCLFNRLFKAQIKKTSKLLVTGLCAGNSPVTGEFSAQRTSNAENVSIWWRHHELATGRYIQLPAETYTDARYPSYAISIKTIAPLPHVVNAMGTVDLATPGIVHQKPLYWHSLFRNILHTAPNSLLCAVVKFLWKEENVYPWHYIHKNQ